MTHQDQDNLDTDEFEPIELGSVLEETRGYPDGVFEIVGALSRDQ